MTDWKLIGITLLIGLSISALIFYPIGYSSGRNTCTLLEQRYSYLTKSYDELLTQMSGLKGQIQNLSADLNRFKTFLESLGPVYAIGDNFYVSYRLINHECVNIVIYNNGADRSFVVRAGEKGESLNVKGGGWGAVSLCLEPGIWTIDVSGVKIKVLVE